MGTGAVRSALMQFKRGAKKLDQYLEDNIQRIPECGCWIWTGRIQTAGYGVTRRRTLAHREAWERLIGRIPSGLYVLHRCDVKLCINPEHLFLGTQLDNIQDCSRKGKMPRGSAHGNNRLTPETVQEIRRLYAQGLSQADISRKLKVDFRNVYHILNKETWTWLEQPC